MGRRGPFLLLSLLCTVLSAPQYVIPVPDFHATGETAAMFGEDDDLRVLIETTTQPTTTTTQPTTTTSTTTVVPTTSFVGTVPVTQNIRVIDDPPVIHISATPSNDPQSLADAPSDQTTQPPPPPPPSSPSEPSEGYDVPSTSTSAFVPPAPAPPLSDAPITTTEVPPPPPPPVSTGSTTTTTPRPTPSPATPTSPPQPIPRPQPHPSSVVVPPRPQPHPAHPSPNQSDGDSPPIVPDLLFVVDASGSMKTAWSRQLQCVEKIARPAAGRSKVGVIIYSSKYKHRLHIPFARHDAATLNSMIQALPFHGGVTNTGEALFEAVRVLERERPQRVAVITMTDGYSWDALDRGSAQIRSIPGTTTYAVALEDIVLKKELDILAGSPERVFIHADSCERLAQVLASGFRKTSTGPPELTTTVPWHHVTPSPQSSNRYSSATIGNEDETHAHFDDHIFIVDGATAHTPDESVAIFDPSPISAPKSRNYWESQHNNLPIPRRNQVEQCALDVVFAFDSTSHAGLPALLAASQTLLHSRVFKKRTVRIGAVKFSDSMDSRIVFALDESSSVSLESILRIDSHRGVEQALFLAAGLMRDAAVVRPTKRIVIVLSDVFDSSTANRALSALQSLNVSVFVLHSTPMATVISHSFPGAVGLTTSVVSHEDISKVEQEVDNLANMCTRRLRRI
ncbi:hypothetical protein PRIPAC_95314 [Pristionchus pacificus]|uniref:VWA domain-containing protein n=1 Tax=Pristionchus pacificus TaxID=54126 RepID=A0A2A6BCZ6_PRIPA|nr:hypothetical protein PRIPAC_95314 [Pristionchus pacificus]|eukprot:PDM63770.1 VWA domain-containing protein [Pristionchus pacificus]